MFVPQPGQFVANRYELIREIGRGGMGCVWQAIDRELEAPCALKFILEHFAQHPELRTRFVREARAVANLHSPYVVSIRGVGEHEDALYIAMELLHGETLERRLERQGALEPPDVVTLVQQTASVLATAHAAGVVHRDLKPENIWLWAESEVFVKLLDFGVAKHVLAEKTALKTATGALVGTPHYMSPEQAAGDRAVDHRSDIWSLAVIAVECLSGRRPFDSDGLGQLLLQIMQGPIPPLNQLYPQATPALEEWWQQAMQRDVEARFQSTTALATSLAAALRSSERPSVSSAKAGAMASDASPTEGRTSAVPEKTEPMLAPPLAHPRAGTAAAQLRASQQSRGKASAASTDTVEPLSHTQSPDSTTRIPLARTPWWAYAVGAGVLISGALWLVASGGTPSGGAELPPAVASSAPPRPNLQLPRQAAVGTTASPSPGLSGSHAAASAPSSSAVRSAPPLANSSEPSASKVESSVESPSRGERSGVTPTEPRRPSPRSAPRPVSRPASRPVDSRVGF